MELVTKFIDCFKKFKLIHKYHFQDPDNIVNHNQMHLLFLLDRLQSTSPEGVKTLELSRLLKLAPPTVTPLINSLENEGHLQRIHDKTDRRVVFIKTTNKGNELINRLKGNVENKTASLLNFLGDSDTKEFLRIMNRIYDYIDHHT